MHDYIDKSLDSINNEITDISKEIITKEKESLEYNMKSFEQRFVSALVTFGVFYVINLLLTTIFALIGLYSIDLVRILCLSASLVGTSLYSVGNIIKCKDGESLKDYLNTKKRHNRVIEEYNKICSIAKLSTDLTINQMSYNNLVTEKSVLASYVERYSFDEKEYPKNEMINDYNDIELQKDVLRKKIDLGVKKCVMLGKYEKILHGYKKNSFAVKYGFLSLLLGLVAWNLPLLVSSIFVDVSIGEVVPAFLTAFLPPAIVSVLFASWGAKREADNVDAFNTINQSFGNDAFDLNLSKEKRKEFMVNFDREINDYVCLNTKSELLKNQISDINVDDSLVEEKRIIVEQVMDSNLDNDKGYSLSLKKKNK